MVFYHRYPLIKIGMFVSAKKTLIFNHQSKNEKMANIGLFSTENRFSSVIPNEKKPYF